MKLKEIEVGYGLTANLGDYESMRVDASIKVELEPGETHDDAYEVLLPWLKDKAKETYQRAKSVDHPKLLRKA